MGVYSTLLPDEKLLKTVEGLERIFILGCMICANSSLAFAKDLTLNKISSDKERGHSGLIPVAIVEEASHVKTVLGTKVKDVRVDVRPPVWLLLELNAK